MYLHQQLIDLGGQNPNIGCLHLQQVSKSFGNSFVRLRGIRFFILNCNLLLLFNQFRFDPFQLLTDLPILKLHSLDFEL